MITNTPQSSCTRTVILIVLTNGSQIRICILLWGFFVFMPTWISSSTYFSSSNWTLSLSSHSDLGEWLSSSRFSSFSAISVPVTFQCHVSVSNLSRFTSAHYKLLQEPIISSFSANIHHQHPTFPRKNSITW